MSTLHSAEGQADVVRVGVVVGRALTAAVEVLGLDHARHERRRRRRTASRPADLIRTLSRATSLRVGHPSVTQRSPRSVNGPSYRRRAPVRPSRKSQPKKSPPSGSKLRLASKATVRGRLARGIVGQQERDRRVRGGRQGALGPHRARPDRHREARRRTSPSARGGRVVGDVRAVARGIAEDGVGRDVGRDGGGGVAHLLEGRQPVQRVRARLAVEGLVVAVGVVGRERARRVAQGQVLPEDVLPLLGGPFPSASSSSWLAMTCRGRGPGAANRR